MGGINKGGCIDLSFIKQGTGTLYCSINKVMNENGFPSKGSEGMHQQSTPLTGEKTEFFSPEVGFRWLFSTSTPKQVIKMTLIQKSAFITLCPSYSLIKRVLGVKTNEVLKQHFPFRTRKIFSSLVRKDKKNGACRNQSLQSFCSCAPTAKPSPLTAVTITSSPLQDQLNLKYCNHKLLKILTMRLKFCLLEKPWITS